MKKLIKKAEKIFSASSRKRRTKLFYDYFYPSEKHKILDLGSEDGSHIASITPFRKNVFIADIDQEMLDRGKKKYGFNTVLIKEDGDLPFEDNFFDIVYCNSTIEHVSVDKTQRWHLKDGREFAQKAFERQRKFASEIQRVGKGYFVQTPGKSFIIESHTWLPLIQFLPRPILISTIKWLNKWWIKKTTPDWYLLTTKQMSLLFPNAVIHKEKVFFLTKSLIAIKPM